MVAVSGCCQKLLVSILETTENKYLLAKVWSQQLRTFYAKARSPFVLNHITSYYCVVVVFFFLSRVYLSQELLCVEVGELLNLSLSLC